MSSSEDEDMKDVVRAERLRGTRHQRAVLSIERERKLTELATLLCSPHCTERRFLEAIRNLGYQEGETEFEQCLKLWKRCHP
jgi:hypothetical protein